MTAGKRPRLISHAARRMAQALAMRQLTGQKRQDALAWLRHPRRTARDIAAFTDRMQAALAAQKEAER